MIFPVALVGALVLVGIAVRVGTREAERSAWDRIAAERRLLAERVQALDAREEDLLYRIRDLDEWEGLLTRADNAVGCPVCELRRARRERPADG